MENFEEYKQTTFKDLEKTHQLIQQPDEFYKLFYKLFDMFKDLKYEDDTAQSLAITLIAYPWTGKHSLSEEELSEAYETIQNRLKYGFFIAN